MSKTKDLTKEIAYIYACLWHDNVGDAMEHAKQLCTDQQRDQAVSDYDRFADSKPTLTGVGKSFRVPTFLHEPEFMLTCPHCGTEGITIHDISNGAKHTCPECGATLIVDESVDEDDEDLEDDE